MEQERKIVTAIPGPKSTAMHTHRLKHVSAGVGAALPVYIERAHGAAPEKQLRAEKKLEAEKAAGTQFTGFTGTRVQILT